MGSSVHRFIGSSIDGYTVSTMIHGYNDSSVHKIPSKLSLMKLRIPVKKVTRIMVAMPMHQYWSLNDSFVCRDNEYVNFIDVETLMNRYVYMCITYIHISISIISTYLYTYVHWYIYIYVYIYIYISTSLHLYTSLSLYMYMYMCLYTCIYIHPYIYISIYIYIAVPTLFTC